MNLRQAAGRVVVAQRPPVEGVLDDDPARVVALVAMRLAERVLDADQLLLRIVKQPVHATVRQLDARQRRDARVGHARGLARAVGHARQATRPVVPEVAPGPVGQRQRRAPPHGVVRHPRLASERVHARDRTPQHVVLVRGPRPARVHLGDQVVLGVVLVRGHGPARAVDAGQSAVLVVGEAVGLARGVRGRRERRAFAVGVRRDAALGILLADQTVVVVVGVRADVAGGVDGLDQVAGVVVGVREALARAVHLRQQTAVLVVRHFFQQRAVGEDLFLGQALVVPGVDARLGAIDEGPLVRDVVGDLRVEEAVVARGQDAAAVGVVAVREARAALGRGRLHATAVVVVVALDAAGAVAHHRQQAVAGVLVLGHRTVLHGHAANAAALPRERHRAPRAVDHPRQAFAVVLERERVAEGVLDRRQARDQLARQDTEDADSPRVQALHAILVGARARQAHALAPVEGLLAGIDAREADQAALTLAQEQRVLARGDELLEAVRPPGPQRRVLVGVARRRIEALEHERDRPR